MVVGERRNHRRDDGQYRQLLDTADPLDQLILKLGVSGKLDVGIVGIPASTHLASHQTYSRPMAKKRGKHTS